MVFGPGNSSYISISFSLSSLWISSEDNSRSFCWTALTSAGFGGHGAGGLMFMFLNTSLLRNVLNLTSNIIKRLKTFYMFIGKGRVNSETQMLDFWRKFDSQDSVLSEHFLDNRNFPIFMLRNEVFRHIWIRTGRYGYFFTSLFRHFFRMVNDISVYKGF